MILDGERTGALQPGRVLLDATSGNTGISYAMLGAARGYRVDALRAGQRHRRTQAPAARVRRGAHPHRSDGGQRRRDPRGAAPLRGAIRIATSIPTSTAIRQTGARTTTRRRSRSSSRPAAASRISSPAWARAARSSARAAGCASGARPCTARVGPAGIGAARARRAEAHGLGDRPGDLRSDPRRSGRARLNRRGLRTRPPAGTPGRNPRRPIERRGAGRLPARGRGRRIAPSSSRSFRTGAIAIFQNDSGTEQETTWTRRPRQTRRRRPSSVDGTCACRTMCSQPFAITRRARIRMNAAGRSSATNPATSSRHSRCRIRPSGERRRRFLIGPDDYRAAEARAARDRQRADRLLSLASRTIRPCRQRSISSTPGRT